MTDKIYVVCDGIPLDIDVDFYDRKEVGDLLNKPKLTKCGFNITLTGFSLEKVNDLHFYALSQGNKAVEIIKVY